MKASTTVSFSKLVQVSSLCAFMWFSACAPKSDNEATPVLSGPPKTALPMPPLNEAESFRQMGWLLDNGQRETARNYDGRVLVLDLYATWCPPCRDSIPQLVDLEKRYSSQGLAIVGLNVGGLEDQGAIPAFAREFRIQYPLGLPEESLMEFLLSGSSEIPQTFIFDRQGQLVKRYIGYDSSMADELESTIVSALNAK